MTTPFKTLEYKPGLLRLLDQRLLPLEERYVELRSPEETILAIQSLTVRGAPALAIAAAYGIALATWSGAQANAPLSVTAFETLCQRMAAARPTAVNLAWAVERMRKVGRATLEGGADARQLRDAIEAEARAVEREDREANESMGRHGAALIPDGARVLTHCNAGALATSHYGTALGVLRAAREAGKRIQVYCDETRPVLQGARLTAWELLRDGFDVTLITDNMAAHLMQRGAIDCAIVGADRIAANGDTANKIGTYGVALAAHRHRLPFYVAAPISTLDAACPDGLAIPIEERDPQEVTTLGGVRVAPPGVKVANPAFDVTPAELITALITERGLATPPNRKTVAALLAGATGEAKGR